MALKASICKVHFQLSDIDRGVYGGHSLTIARHPSETDERMMVRVLAYALHIPADNNQGALALAKSLWDTDEPDLWQKDLSGQIVQWIDVGQPDERRIMRASARAERVVVMSYATSTPIWWRNVASKISRARNVVVWQIEPAQSQILASLAQRSMQLQISVQDGSMWISADDERTVEITPQVLNQG